MSRLQSETDDALLSRAGACLEARPALLPNADLSSYVATLLPLRDQCLALARRRALPVYLFDEAALRRRAQEFRAAFQARLVDTGFFYAMKSNNHPDVARCLVDCGFGLDVSSGVELATALEVGAREIAFSGPGKVDAELCLAAQHADRTTVLMDSFGELERLEAIAASADARVRAGVRLTSDPRGLWRKFGVPLAQMSAFWDAAERCPHIDLAGIQFHTSWNMQPDNQIGVIEALGREIATWPVARRRSIAFLDIGGGFWPERGEWLLEAGIPAGRLRAALGEESSPTAHYRVDAFPIDAFAERLAEALRRHVLEVAPCRICFEPGRWLSNDCMHLLLSVVDRKAPDLVITDGGTNLIGWERFETDYAPILNLTRPASVERPCHVLGSLCTPHDVWGYAYWGEDIQPGDVLLIPHQGAYTYSLRQAFIKPLPQVEALR